MTVPLQIVLCSSKFFVNQYGSQPGADTNPSANWEFSGNFINMYLVWNTYVAVRLIHGNHLQRDFPQSVQLSVHCGNWSVLTLAPRLDGTRRIPDVALLIQAVLYSDSHQRVSFFCQLDE
eukprot:308706_1